MDDFCEQEHEAWLDEQNAVVSFHEIPGSRCFCAPDGTAATACSDEIRLQSGASAV